MATAESSLATPATAARLCEYFPLHRQHLSRLGEVLVGLVLTAAIAVFTHGAESLPTPLEAAGYARLSSSSEISEYLERLARAYPNARVERFGDSVQGRPLQAILLTQTEGADVSTSDRLTILMVGSQHGTEAAGAESLLFIARELLAGGLRPVLEDIDVVLVPNANPDGRDLGKRANANGINLNIDFVALTQPESRALVGALKCYRPEVVLDIHESAVLKRKSLAREGYMTDFMAQFEAGNNSNIVPALQNFAMDDVLESWIASVGGAGILSHRYFGEIRSSRQPVTNGGLTLNNFRNRAAIEGAISLLMESRLDPRDGQYTTFRNIGVRVALQRICIERLLRLLQHNRADALAVIAAARPQASSAPLTLGSRYVAVPGNPRVKINLRRIDDKALESIEFADHRAIATTDQLPFPAAYIVHDHQDEFRALLDRHGVKYRTLKAGRSENGVRFEVGSVVADANATMDQIREHPTRVRAEPGDLWIDLAQPRGRLAAVLLEPRSTSSLFRTAAYFPLFTSGKALPVYRIPR